MKRNYAKLTLLLSILFLFLLKPGLRSESLLRQSSDTLFLTPKEFILSSEYKVLGVLAVPVKSPKAEDSKNIKKALQNIAKDFHIDALKNVKRLNISDMTIIYGTAITYREKLQKIFYIVRKDGKIETTKPLGSISFPKEEIKGVIVNTKKKKEDFDKLKPLWTPLLSTGKVQGKYKTVTIIQTSKRRVSKEELSYMATYLKCLKELSKIAEKEKYDAVINVEIIYEKGLLFAKGKAIIFLR